ncbi:MAG: hypothetical protein JNL32_11725, partial [Candidatus Kapabacteria bacterium]|nr:hypothetical protein [Candidatus Kapabacteria bacterium]
MNTHTQSPDQTGSQHAGKRILIADDSASMRKFVSLSLKVIGCTVVSAVD